MVAAGIDQDFDCMNTFIRAAASAALAGAISFAAFVPAFAVIDDYAFELVRSDIQKSDAAVVSVRLINKRTGKTVPDAVIFETRADMAPDGMEAMTAPIEELPSEEPGVYRFKVDLVMQGGWQISLGAKIQGEDDTLRDKLVIKAVQ